MRRVRQADFAPLQWSRLMAAAKAVSAEVEAFEAFEKEEGLPASFEPLREVASDFLAIVAEEEEKRVKKA